MSTPNPRYAIYFVPSADTALYRFGTSVLGYDCYSGRDIPPIEGVDASSWIPLVREPRVYGFHATLKAPFRLADGLAEADLTSALETFAADHPAVLAGELTVRELGSFIALVPQTPDTSIDRLAQACVVAFDRFRAALTPQERERRLKAGLSARQTEHLDRWGYPYVFEDFCFHMTLTGPLAPPDRRRALQFLRDKFAQIPAARSLILDRIVLARQPDGGAPFRVIREAHLGHSAYRPYAYSC